MGRLQIREFENMQRLSHENVVKLLAIEDEVYFKYITSFEISFHSFSFFCIFVVI